MDIKGAYFGKDWNDLQHPPVGRVTGVGAGHPVVNTSSHRQHQPADSKGNRWEDLVAGVPGRKRGGTANIKREGADGEQSKRQRVELIEVLDSDDGDNDDERSDVSSFGDVSDYGDGSSPYSYPIRPISGPLIPDTHAATPPPVDHSGRPLSEEALAEAQMYWDCQRKLDACPFDVQSAQASTLPVDLLLELAWHRRAYTRLLLGVHHLEPGTRTYEPPYVDPPPQLPIVMPGQELNAVAAVPAPGPPGAPQPEPRTEPVLCPEQMEVVELAASGRNVFYTGSAGCGKSTVLHAVRRRLEGMGKTVRVIAPTGKVALAINGTTTWTFAGWTPDHHKRRLTELEKMARGRKPRMRFTQTDVVIIDEISMVENLHLERLNAVMKAGRNCDDPFGGVQVIVTGDFCQLPPVKPFQHCITCGRDLISKDEEHGTIHSCRECRRTYPDSDKWAFKSDAWKECNFAHVHLKSIHRQRDDRFISMLQKCRLGIPFTPEEVDILMGHRSVTANAVKLFSTREEVRRTNEEAFARLRTPPHPYRSFDQFIWDRESHPQLEYKGQRNADGSLRALEDHRFERRIELKVGMLVVLLVNLDLPSGLCNGSQGIIAGFEPYDPSKLPQIAEREDGTGYAAIREAHVKEFAKQQLTDPPRAVAAAAIAAAAGAAAGGTAPTTTPPLPPPPRPPPPPPHPLRPPTTGHPTTTTPSTATAPPTTQDRINSLLGWPVVRFLNGVTRPILPQCQVHELGDVKPYSLLCRTQIPLAPAWALSIHKSQGMTLDRVVVDLSRAFEEGQVYVALSRATSLEGLRVEGSAEGLAVGRGGNGEVREFLRRVFGM